MSNVSATGAAVAMPGGKAGGHLASRRGLRYRLRRIQFSGIIGVFLVISIFTLALLAHLVTPYDPMAHNLNETLQGPSGEHWLGTDEFGRDLFARILYGARISLQIAAGAVLLGALVGVPLGMLGGYFKGLWDTLAMRAIDVLLAFPGILLAIAIVSALGPGLNNLILAVGVFSIPAEARIARSVALSTSELEYVMAARALGAGNLRILLRHVFPAAVSPLIVVMSLYMATALLTASGLSFLGIGVPPSIPEWGAMLSQGRIYFRSSPHVAVFPGLAIMFTVMAFNLTGEGLRDMLDPKSERRGRITGM